MDLINKDILKLVMNMDFDSQNFSSSYLKDLIVKFRYYYRVKDSMYNSKESEIYKLNKVNEKLIRENDKLKKDIEIITNKYNYLKSKKITFKEYLKGKRE